MTKPNDVKAFVLPGRDEAKPAFDKVQVNHPRPFGRNFFAPIRKRFQSRVGPVFAQTLPCE